MQDPELSDAGDRVRILGRAYESIASTYMLTAWFATEDWVGRNAGTARRVASALIAAGEWAMAHPAPATDIFEKYTNVRLAHFGETFARTLDPTLLQPVFDAAAKYRVIAGPLDARQIIWSGA